jgi:succinate dehydrogenase / fumarate reductase, cytochrome b subunit
MIGVSKLRATSRYSPQAIRSYQVGMWAWLLHRLSGLALVGYLFVHIWVISSVAAINGRSLFDAIMLTFSNRFIIALELGLIAIVIYHGLNGIRVLLFDVGVGLNNQKQIFWSLMGLGSAMFVAGAWALWPAIFG